MMRGDDVGELQLRLGSLGFDPGTVDGIFGPKTMTALQEFQDNVALPPDGICGPTTVVELLRVYGRSNEHIHSVRERETIRSRFRRASDLLVVVAAREELSGPGELTSLRLRQQGLRSLVIQSPDQAELAQRANALKGDVCIYLDFSTGGLQIAYYSGFSYTSPGGQRIAQFITESLSSTLVTSQPTMKGMTLPILRNTRMLTVALQLDPPALWVTSAHLIAKAAVDAISRFLENPGV
jgi:N-acetylmuramoyl-L-alanine amidase